MTSAPILEVGQSVLVAPTADEPPWRMLVDVVQDGVVTLATPDDEQLPSEWHELGEIHITTLDRFSVHLIHVPVRRVGDTRLVIGAPDESTPVQRRAYARVFAVVPASFTVLDPVEKRWMPFEAEIRDLGGGGCSAITDRAPADGSTIAMALAIDDQPPVAVLGRVLPREGLPTVGKLLLRIEFVLIREADRDRILRFILLALAGRRHVRTQSSS
jgi:hypothetical protein